LIEEPWNRPRQMAVRPARCSQHDQQPLAVEPASKNGGQLFELGPDDRSVTRKPFSAVRDD
jgi:hypothetical protein